MQYDKKGNLTRAGMDAVHKSGASVVYKGEIIPPGGKLPSEAELAKQTGDSSEVERVRRDNEAEIKRLQDENAKLKAEQAKKPDDKPVEEMKK